LASHQFDIKVIIKEECHAGPDKPTKRIIKSEGAFQYISNKDNLPGKSGSGLTPFPKWDSVRLTISNFEIITGNPDEFYHTNTNT
jgi:hypothetical protein